MTRRIGHSTAAELDTRLSPVPSLASDFVPERVLRRRRRLRALREGGAATEPTERAEPTGAPGADAPTAPDSAGGPGRGDRTGPGTG